MTEEARPVVNRRGLLPQYLTGRRAEVWEPMATIYPFHPVQPSDRAVFHDNNACEEAASIPKANRRDGTGGRPKCERCEELDREEEASDPARPVRRSDAGLRRARGVRGS